MATLESVIHIESLHKIVTEGGLQFGKYMIYNKAEYESRFSHIMQANAEYNTRLWEAAKTLVGYRWGYLWEMPKFQKLDFEALNFIKGDEELVATMLLIQFAGFSDKHWWQAMNPGIGYNRTIEINEVASGFRDYLFENDLVEAILSFSPVYDDAEPTQTKDNNLDQCCMIKPPEIWEYVETYNTPAGKVALLRQTKQNHVKGKNMAWLPNTIRDENLKRKKDWPSETL